MDRHHYLRMQCCHCALLKPSLTAVFKERYSFIRHSLASWKYEEKDHKNSGLERSPIRGSSLYILLNFQNV